MGLSGDDARYILEADKRLARRQPWSVAGGSRIGCARRVKFECRINLRSTMPRGIWFRASVIPQYADGATFQIECENLSYKSHIPLFRLDWRPMQVHVNSRGCGPEELQGLFIDAGVTHTHSCLDHIDAETGEIPPAGVHMARIVSPDFASYDQALIWFCRQTRIINSGDIPPPPMQGEMF